MITREKTIIAIDPDVDKSGKMKFNLKRDFHNIEKMIVKETQKAYSIFDRCGKEESANFIKASDIIDEYIADHLALKGEERATKVLASVFNVIENKCEQIPERLRFGYDGILECKNIIKRHIELESSQGLKFIVEKAFSQIQVDYINS